MKSRNLGFVLTVIVLALATSCSNPEKELEKARAQNSIEALNAVIERYPDSEYATEARKGIDEIIDLQKHPLKNEGFEHLLVLDDEYTMQCGDDESPVRAFKAEEPTLITNDDFENKFNWNGEEKLFRPRDANPDHFAGVAINPEGERELHGSFCLGNLQLSGPITMKSGGMLFQKDALLIHVVSDASDTTSSVAERE